MADEIILAPANPLWPQLFEIARTELLNGFGSRIIEVAHVGSTAVPGLDAKPVIDMLGGVASMADADALLQPLVDVGWDTSPAFNATLTDRRFLRRLVAGLRTHHLHLTIHNSEEMAPLPPFSRLAARQCKFGRRLSATQIRIGRKVSRRPRSLHRGQNRIHHAGVRWLYVVGEHVTL